MLTGYEFRRGPWQDVEWLIAETQAFYDANITPKGLGDRFSVAAAKIVEQRNWGDSQRLFKGHMEEIVRELGIFYVPKQMDPGPGIVFPQQDITGRNTHGKFHPFYELVLKDTPVKYANLGNKDLVQGPNWFGHTDVTIQRAIETKSAFLVEGYYDLLAARLMAPWAPILSNGTKSISDDHILYLRMLGVTHIYLMFDNEAPKEGKTLGAGNQAMEFFARKWNGVDGLEVTPLRSLGEDASRCLEHSYRASRLRNFFEALLP